MRTRSPFLEKEERDKSCLDRQEKRYMSIARGRKENSGEGN